MSNAPKRLREDTASWHPVARVFALLMRPGAGRVTLFVVAGLALVLALLDLVFARKTYVPGESTIGFFVLLGALAGLGVCGVGALVWEALARPKDYYGERDHDA